MSVLLEITASKGICALYEKKAVYLWLGYLSAKIYSLPEREIWMKLEEGRDGGLGKGEMSN